MRADFDPDVVATLMEDAARLVRENERALAGPLEDREAQLRAYALFDDALTAASAARAR